MSFSVFVVVFVVICGYVFVVVRCGCALWLCVVDVSLRLCVCAWVLVVAFVVMYLWLCVVVVY